MEKEFDIAIVGGGVYGAACAWFLSQHNRRVLLIEKNRVGTSGATGVSRGIVRVYDPDEDLARVSLEGTLQYLHWESNKYPGLNPYSASGFVYLFDKAKEAAMTEAIQRYGTADYPMELLSADMIARRFPWIRGEGKMGIYELYGGYGDPRLTALSFMTGFRAKGGTVYENCEVKGFEPGWGDGWRIALPHGKIAAKVVLFTAGGYTRKLLPSLPLFTRSISLAQVTHTSRHVDMTIVDESVETYLRPGDDTTFYCGSQVFESVTDPDELQTERLDIVTDAIERVEKVLTMPAAGDIVNHFNGYDCYTDDKRPVVQFLPGYKGLYAASGFSGRGYKCATAVSRQVALEISAYLGTTNEVAEGINWRIKL